jgi:hypothetical protein
MKIGSERNYINKNISSNISDLRLYGTKATAQGIALSIISN